MAIGVGSPDIPLGDADPLLDDSGLGRIKVVDARRVWGNEAVDFTPWLAANLELLAEALDLEELSTIQREVPVGAFFLDLLAEDASGRRVIIENQLGSAEHGHLGQLMVYAAGTQADVVVWVTTRFRDEYRAVLDWLNSQTGQDVNFFGIEVRLVQIGTSPPAPVFDVIVKPNAWEKAQRQAQTAPTPTALARQALFRTVFEGLAERIPTLRVPSPGLQNWVNFKSGPFGTYGVVFSQRGLRVEVYLDGGNRTANKLLFDELYKTQPDIEASVGMPLEWERLDNKRASRLASYYGQVDLSDEEAAGAASGWATDTAARLVFALDERLRRRGKELRMSSGDDIAE